MATEIERRFLVKVDLLPETSETPFCRIDQAYLSRKPSVRVRIMTTPNDSTRAYLTIKGKGTISRAEYEYAIPIQDVVGLMDLAKFGSISKYRYYIEYADKHWELDRFSKNLKGLYLAEIELTSIDEVIELPPWVGLEVTEDPRYTNASLALDGLPT